MNSYACEKLSVMEEQYPVITRSTDEVLKEGREKCADLVKPITDRVNNVKDTYRGAVNKGQEAVREHSFGLLLPLVIITPPPQNVGEGYNGFALSVCPSPLSCPLYKSYTN